MNEENKKGVATFYETADGKKYAIKNGMETITKNDRTYQLGIDITEEPVRYAIIVTYKKNDQTYMCVDNDPDILAELLGFDKILEEMD